MKLSYDLKIEQTQRLTLTPELIQSISILQYNSQELSEYIQRELMENPLIEVDETSVDIESNSYEYLDNTDAKEELDSITDGEEYKYDDISYSHWKRENDESNLNYENFVQKPLTLIDYLLEQLSFSKLTGIERKIGTYIIESLDDNGYLPLKIGEIARIFKVDPEFCGNVLDTIQTFEPSGIACRSIEECLLVQLMSKGLLEDSIEYIVLNYFDDLANNRLQVISKKTGMSLDEIKMVKELISSLNPKPGKSFAGSQPTKYIIPDIALEKNGDKYSIRLNENNIPRLVISREIDNLEIEASNDENLAKYLDEKYKAGSNLIKAIEQRSTTIRNVTRAIVKYQEEYFTKGSKYLKKLTMKQIADEVGVHESTVSRAVSGKYIETPNGLFELKFFFSSGGQIANGSNIAAEGIKEHIREIVKSEDPKHPYSDQDIEQILKDRGIDISRRTIAKYRENMNILSSSKRKQM